MASDEQRSGEFRPRKDILEFGPDFYDAVAPAAFPRRILRYRNQRAAGEVGLDRLDDDAWLRHFWAFEPLPGSLEQPLALRYHGHQFRSYNPDIGDGRGFLFAQLLDRDDRLLDLGTKGSGQTPYSRFGDGRLTLKGGVREILAAEMLEAQGVYTSKAFSLFETGEALQRGDEPSPTRSAVLTRLSHSHIRFGTFQRLAALDQPEQLAALLDHSVENYWPGLDLIEGADRAAAFLEAVVAATARLAAQWMAAGFVHGVLNTDNMTITGESFDYGPWRFLPENDPGFTAAYFDHNGLYAFGRQPEAAAWNLTQLAIALTLIGEAETLEAALQTFSAAYGVALSRAVLTRLGLQTGDADDDRAFLQTFFTWMRVSRAPWAQVFHDWFCGRESAGRAANSPIADRYGEAGFAPVRDGLTARAAVRPERLAHAYFTRATPADLLIDQVESLWSGIARQDDWSAFAAKIAEITEMREALALNPRARL
jgi:serine/tyrosine/threonine adenylyltransferase